MRNFKYCPYCRAKLSAKNVDGRPRGVCRSCGWIYYRNPLPAVAALVSNKKGEILLIKRGVEPYKGEWCVPGGFVEMGETIREALKRELKEETGLTGNAGRSVGASIQKSKMYGAVLITGFEVKMTGGVLMPGDDALDARFFDPRKLPKIPLQSHRLLIRSYFAKR